MQRLARIIRSVTPLLPAQGPISIFVHHNTLHAYEYLPFESAVVEAADLFGCEPFLTEAEYREAIASGRIRDEDLRAVVADELGERAGEPLTSLTTHGDFRLALLRGQLRDVRGPALTWMLAEHRSETRAYGALWEACRRAADVLVESVAVTPRAPIRHRDLLLAVTGADSDALVHPVFIRWCAAFLDQGVAYWAMPGRALGFYGAIRQLYRDAGWVAEPWLRPLIAELARADSADRDPVGLVLESLTRLGVEEPEWEPFLAATLLTLRGWAGMMHQVEARPDRVPVEAPPARLVDFLALRLLCERFAVAHVARDALAWSGPLASLRPALVERLAPPRARTADERAWLLFELARLLGWHAGSVVALAPADVAALFAELDRTTEDERRRLLHLAYERRHRQTTLDALTAYAGEPVIAQPRPKFQSVHCLDEREESLRRHLEEVEPACETYGTAGFFGVAMYYRGVAAAHAVPLCPIAIRPAHEVEEVVVASLRDEHRRRRVRRRRLGRLTHEARLGSRTLTRGALLSFALGLAAAVPLVFRVMLPRLTARVRRGASRLVRAPARSRLLLERRDRPPTLGAHSGFTIEEMRGIVLRVLTDVGLTTGFAPLVLIVGHGSSSLNNPHESAHDCGACGGGRGGPNARAFAQMANDPRVRTLLRRAGVDVPATTRFVGAFHNSCDDAVSFDDVDQVPESHVAELAHVRAVFEEARTRTAHERCRRFDSAPLTLTPAQALAHVEARCEDLAQPRPEYGHATNAVCVIGRRARTRGLFMDRRAFLVSYDPDADDAAGTILDRVLAGVVPVVAGINLEYYFSRVDPAGYGCGTKLPHNVTALLGVMDGHASDLRTGLPWQMVEIHEPVRVLIVVEAEPDRLRRIVAANDDLGRLLQNRWIQLGSWNPATGELAAFTRRGFAPHRREETELPRAASSRDWYGGRRGFLPYASIRP